VGVGAIRTRVTVEREDIETRNREWKAKRIYDDGYTKENVRYNTK
jgi:hypothetical protein